LGVDDSHVVFDKKNSLLKKEKECETVRCHAATASSYVAEVRSEVFAHFRAVSINCDNKMQN
jgi:hypothetical protein